MWRGCGAYSSRSFPSSRHFRRKKTRAPFFPDRLFTICHSRMQPRIFPKCLITDGEDPRNRFLTSCRHDCSHQISTSSLDPSFPSGLPSKSSSSLPFLDSNPIVCCRFQSGYILMSSFRGDDFFQGATRLGHFAFTEREHIVVGEDVCYAAQNSHFISA